MKNNNLLFSYLIFIGVFIFGQSYAQNNHTLTLSNENLNLTWEKSAAGYILKAFQVKDKGNKVALNQPSGEYSFLYCENEPSSEILPSQISKRAFSFPDSSYGHFFDRWKNSLSSVPLNMTGKAIDFFPSKYEQNNNKSITFSKETPKASISASWELDPIYKNDIVVEMILEAKIDGYFSLSSPILATIKEKELSWATVPGYFQGKGLESDLVLSYGYGQGIPNRPVILRERVASTLSPLISTKEGVTLAVIPDPGQGRDPWENNIITQNKWKLGLSVMNRKGELTPVLYHPVLGEEGSYMEKGEKLTFSFRYTVQSAHWFEVYKHAINDIYRFKNVLTLKDTKESLSNRFFAITKYVNNDTSSMWNIKSFEGLKIGAQDYLSSVYDKDDDAMKNSDYGAMWMLANITDSTLMKTRLPYARNFKLAQQQKDSGYFQGAAMGQYYLWKTSRFVEEWGNYVEPIGLTYYVMLDIGNILLFNANDTLLQERLRLGAERLIKWQHFDGSWEVAYDRRTNAPIFTDLKDLRPTFYGLLVAYRILGDEKYLHAACRGADWFIENAVNNGSFLGVCGDFRFAPDFATGQSVQALLDLYEITKEEKYKIASIKTAQIYTTYIYTHPIPDRSKKMVQGIEYEDWEISQVGSRVEQSGLLGSANGSGPILLTSHAGMFVRLFELTNDSIYIDMARVATWGQDAFVNPTTHVASYYWKSMNAGVGRYPHHAWWQIGWIMDYLLAEIQLRSDKKISFPRGFVTPKVGPHQTYGFASGEIFGKEAKLFMHNDVFTVFNQRVDFIGTLNESSSEMHLILLNNSDKKQLTSISIDKNKIIKNKSIDYKEIHLLDESGRKVKGLKELDSIIELLPYGLKVIKICFE